MTQSKRGDNLNNHVPSQGDPMLMGVDAVARKLSIGRSLAYSLIMSGEISSIKVGSRRLIPAIALEAFIKAQMGKQYDSHADSHGDS